MKKLKTLSHLVKSGEWEAIVRAVAHNLIPPALLFTKLPLPQTYSTIICGSHGVGLTAFLKYLQLSFDMENLIYRKFKYFGIQQMALTYRNSYIPITLEFLTHKLHKNTQKYSLVFDMSLPQQTHSAKILQNLKHKVPILVPVRDPISCLKCWVQRVYMQTTMMFQYKAMSKEESIKNTIEYFLTKMSIKMGNYGVNFTSLPSLFLNATQSLHYIDMSEFSNGRAYTCMSKIANIIKLNLKKDAQHNLEVFNQGNIKDAFTMKFPYKIMGGGAEYNHILAYRRHKRQLTTHTKKPSRS